MARAKVCGITRRADVEAAVEAGADAVGFVVDVDVDTPREIAPTAAANLAALVPPFVVGTLVTMPKSATDAVSLAERVGADAVQLHGLQPETVAAVAESFHGDVIAAIPGSEARDTLDAHAQAADALLLDTPTATGAGGTGKTHDWERASDIVDRVDAPVILAGGLTPRIVREAIQTVDPYAVDVASGVEASGGIKDHAAVRRFVQAAGGTA